MLNVIFICLVCFVNERYNAINKSLSAEHVVLAIRLSNKNKSGSDFAGIKEARAPPVLNLSVLQRIFSNALDLIKPHDVGSCMGLRSIIKNKEQ